MRNQIETSLNDLLPVEERLAIAVRLHDADPESGAILAYRNAIDEAIPLAATAIIEAVRPTTDAGVDWLFKKIKPDFKFHFGSKNKGRQAIETVFNELPGAATRGIDGKLGGDSLADRLGEFLVLDLADGGDIAQALLAPLTDGIEEYARGTVGLGGSTDLEFRFELKEQLKSLPIVKRVGLSIPLAFGGELQSPDNPGLFDGNFSLTASNISLDGLQSIDLRAAIKSSREIGLVIPGPGPTVFKDIEFRADLSIDPQTGNVSAGAKAEANAVFGAGARPNRP